MLISVKRAVRSLLFMEKAVGMYTVKSGILAHVLIIRVYALIRRTCAYRYTCTLRMRKISRAGPASIAMASQGEAVCVGGCCTRPPRL